MDSHSASVVGTLNLKTFFNFFQSDESNTSDCSIANTSPIASTSTGVTRKRIPQNQPNLQREAMMNMAVQVMNRPQDSCQIFGDFVADQLRRLKIDKREKLERAIQRTILNITEENSETNLREPQAASTPNKNYEEHDYNY